MNWLMVKFYESRLWFAWANLRTPTEQKRRCALLETMSCRWMQQLHDAGIEPDLTFPSDHGERATNHYLQALYGHAIWWRKEQSYNKRSGS